MRMKIDNLCDSCTNIGCEFQSGIVRTKCSFYMPPHIEPDNCGNYVVMQPTVEAIPKDQYEAILKADMVAMLTEIKMEIEELDSRAGYDGNGMSTFSTDYIRKKKVNELIQQKINALKEETND